MLIKKENLTELPKYCGVQQKLAESHDKAKGTGSDTGFLSMTFPASKQEKASS